MFLLLQSKEGMPMRFPTGVSRDRFNLITAVLAKHARLKVRFTYNLRTTMHVMLVMLTMFQKSRS